MFCAEVRIDPRLGTSSDDLAPRYPPPCLMLDDEGNVGPIRAAHSPDDVAASVDPGQHRRCARDKREFVVRQAGLRLSVFGISRDAKYYVHSYPRLLSELYVVEGLK